jgi:AcrR family transcriptional regulator
MAAQHPPPVRRRNSRGQGHALRADLVDATTRLVASSDRPESLTLRQIARAVGIAPASVYGHFPDLGALLDEVLRLRHAELAGLLDAADGTTTALGRLTRRSAVFVRWGVEHPGEYRSLFGGRAPTGVSTPASHSAGNALLAGMTQALAAAVDPAGARDRRTTWRGGLLLTTSLHGLIDAFTAHPGIDWPGLDDLVAGVVSAFTGAPVEDLTAFLTDGPPPPTTG